MKALVVGGGSIGSRHLANLKTLGQSPLAIVEPNEDRRSYLCRDGDVSGFSSLERALEWEPDLAIIASPSHLHLEHALETARQNCHIFIEKPLSHIAAGLTELVCTVEDRGIVSMVGFNMRFHPGPRKIKQLLDDQCLGKIFYARIHTGSYLPHWRPTQDYTKSYSAHSSLGGGCLFDCIHEIDLAIWYLGKPEAVFCTAEHLSFLEIDAEDFAALICKHAGNIISEIHLDFCQMTYERGCQIVGEKGSIFWDYSDGEVRWFDGISGSWTTFTQPERWEKNDMYLDELQHFVKCIDKSVPTSIPVKEATEATLVALAAKQSAHSGRFIPTGSILP